MLKLRSIDEEAAACRATWATCPGATWGLHIHHQIVAEPLTEPIERRITHILREKSIDEQALRLRLMRPCPATVNEARQIHIDAFNGAKLIYPDASGKTEWIYDTTLAEAGGSLDAALDALHTAHCITDCPWDGTTIFSDKKGDA